MSIKKQINLLDADICSPPIGSIIWALATPTELALMDETARWKCCDGSTITLSSLSIDSDNFVKSALYNIKSGSSATRITIDVTTFARRMNQFRLLRQHDDLWQIELPDLTGGRTIIGANDVDDGTFFPGGVFSGNLPVVRTGNDSLSWFYGAQDDGGNIQGQNNDIISSTSKPLLNNWRGGAFICTTRYKRAAGQSSYGGFYKLKYEMDATKLFPEDFTKQNLEDKLVPTGICAYAFIRVW